MTDMTTRILEALGRPSYSPIKPKVLFKRMNLDEDLYPEFRKTARALVHEGKVVQGRNNTLKLGETISALLGTYKRTAGGKGFVRLDTKPGEGFLPDVLIRDGRELDAANGDRVMVKLSRKSTNLENAKGEIIKIVERGTRTFVGTYFERDGEAFVRVDGTVFAHSISVGDPGAKGVRSQDKVQIEIIRFPLKQRTRRRSHHRSVRAALGSRCRFAHSHPGLRNPRYVRRRSLGRGSGRGRRFPGSARRSNRFHERSRCDNRPD